MTSPVSIGDAIAVINQICLVIDAYKNTPSELRQVLRKFHDTESELEALNKVLAGSMRKEYRYFPGTKDLLSDLQDAREYFQRYGPLISPAAKTGMASRIKHTAKAKWSWGQVQDYASKMDRHRESMEKFKQTVLLQAANDNIQLQISQIQMQLSRDTRLFHSRSRHSDLPDDASTISSDQMSVLTKASKSLSIARQLESVPEPRPRLALSPILESNASATESLGPDPDADLKQTIADYVERKELYRPDALQVTRLKELQYVAELPYLWEQRQQSIKRHPQQNRQQDRHRQRDNVGPAASTSPALTAPSMWSPPQPSQPTTLNFDEKSGHVSNPDFETNSISQSWIQAFDGLGIHAKASIRSGSITERLPPPVMNPDEISIAESIVSNSSDSLDDGLVLHDTVLLYTPWAPSTPVPCHLKVTESVTSICVRSTTVQKFHPEELPSHGGRRGFSPSSLLNMPSRTSDAISASDMEPLVFNHAVLGGMGSFPRILHPSAEGRATSTNTHPYVIEFYDPQFLTIQGYDNSDKVPGFAYNFRTRADRDLVREKIFGKTLLASAGVKTIQFDKIGKAKPCGTQAMSLWTTTEAGRQLLTITIQCTTKNRAHPDCAIEFAVLKAKGVDAARNQANKTLDLKIQAIPVFVNDTSDATMSGGVHSSNSSEYSNRSDYSPSIPSTSPRSRMSIATTPKRRSSVLSAITLKPEEPFHCYVKFTEETEESRQSKKKFLDAIPRQLCA